MSDDGSSGNGGGGGGFWSGTDGLQTMGILNALRTGDPIVDMILAMCLPVFLHIVFGAAGKMGDDWFCYESWERWWYHRTRQHRRFITYRSAISPWGGSTSLDADSQNTVLLKAIQLYLHSQVKLKLTSADLNLTSTEDRNASIGGSYGDYDDDEYCYDDDDNRNGSRSSRTVVGILSKFRVVKAPLKDVWHRVGSYGSPPAVVELKIRHTEETSGGDGRGGSTSTHITKVFHFASTHGHAIDAFVDCAYKWYMEELRKLEDNSRYLYELKSVGSGGGSDGGGNDDQGDMCRRPGSIYTRYKLSDEKTFESLFFRQKEPLLNLIRHFQNRTGKYAVKGYPHKLGLLLHGPPGSGKTSLIKALAQYTNRSIVNVPLARISTNADLMSIFFDHNFYIQGEDVPVKLGFKDVIFVMEDVDAASKIVKRRDGKITADRKQTEHIDLPLPKSMWRMLLESTEPDCKELVEQLMDKSERLKREATKPDVLRSVADRMMVLPGLGLVGEAGGDDPALEKISSEAVESANRLMDDYSTVDRFVSTHARAMKTLLDSGAEVDDAFVDTLLGLSPPIPRGSLPATRNSISREVSITSYGGGEGPVHVEASDKSEAALMASMAQFMEQSLCNSGGGGGGGGENSGDGATTPSHRNSDKKSDSRGAVIGQSWGGKPQRDQLNLTGLLNVLDGVVDSPGRVVIMTTNHPEYLDPALIRPGRIDKKLHLAYMAAEDVTLMLEHYFQTDLTEDETKRVHAVVHGNKQLKRPQLNLTPAQVEQLTAEHDELEDMISVLEDKGRSLVPPTATTTSFGGTISRSAVAFEV